MSNSNSSPYHFITERDSLNNANVDFLMLIQTIQHLNKNTAPHFRISKDSTESLKIFLDLVIKNQESLTTDLQQTLGYSVSEAQRDLEESLKILEDVILNHAQFNPSVTIPQRLVAIYGSWSSPLYRFFKNVIPALTQQTSVLLFCDPESSAIYTQLAKWVASTELGFHRISVLPITDPEVYSALLEHPSLQGLKIQTHLYDSAFVRKHCTSPEKIYDLHFGAHNPVIVLNDAPLETVFKIFEESLKFHQRSEIRFNRWFIQEKIFAEILKKIQDQYPMSNAPLFGKMPTQKYNDQFERQYQELTKSKNWLHPLKESSFNICTDFSNCSPLHQTELLGPLLTITRVKNSAEATKFANTTQHSNVSCILTSSDDKYLEAAHQQRTPFVFKNRLPRRFDDCLESGDRFCSLKTTATFTKASRTVFRESD